MMWGKGQKLSCAVIAAGPLLLFLPFLFGGKAIFWGTPVLQFVPWRLLAWEILKLGQFPLWNPYSGMGAPLLANYQSALLYPPNWLYFPAAEIFGVSGVAWMQSVIAALHLVWAALGMQKLLQRLRVKRLGQWVAALAFSLSAYYFGRTMFLSMNAAIAWLPWLLVFVWDLAKQERKLPTLLWLGAASGMQLLAGHAQITWYSFAFAFAWAGFLFWQTKPGSGQAFARHALKFWLALLAGFLLGVALAAAQLIPTAEYLAQSQRSSAVDYEFALNYSFWPWRVITLFAPDFFGSPVRGDFSGYANYWEDALYIGLLPLLLAIGAGLFALRQALRYRSRQDVEPGSEIPAWKIMLFWLLLGWVSFLLALGKNTPVFPWLYRNIPTFDMFQAPTRINLGLVLALAILAGYGAHAWRRPAGKALYWSRLGTAGFAAVALTAGLLGLVLNLGVNPELSSIRPAMVAALAWLGLMGMAAGLLHLRAPRTVEEGDLPGDGKPSRVWLALVVGLLLLDLVKTNWGMLPGLPLALYGEKQTEIQALRDQLQGNRIYLSPNAEEQLKFDRFFQFDTFAPKASWEQLMPSLLPNTNLFFQVNSTNNFDPLLPGRYEVWMETLASADGETKERMLNLMQVQVVEEMGSSTGAEARWVERNLPGQSAWYGCAKIAASEAQALGMVIEGLADEHVPAVVVEGVSEVKPCQAAGAVTILNRTYTPNLRVYAIDSAQDGYFVMREVWYPGWKAFLDGRPVEVPRADYLFRAVEIPAGEHELTIRYQPISFTLGLLVSLMGIIFWAGLWTYAARKKQAKI